MLEATFLHLARVGKRRERELWRRGVFSWDELQRLQDRQLSFFSDPDELLEESRRALDQGDADFFATLLPRREHYRIALAFPLRTLFLDIETTGLSLHYDSVTLVGWSLGPNYGVYITGQDPKELYQALMNTKAVVTFNGSLFDLPFVRKHFPDLKLPAAHIDLRFFGRRVGLAGPQKTIEASLGFSRDNDLLEIDGRFATILWHKHLRGDSNALRMLVRYNHADVEGMKQTRKTSRSRCFAASYASKVRFAIYRISSRSRAPDRGISSDKPVGALAGNRIRLDRLQHTGISFPGQPPRACRLKFPE